MWDAIKASSGRTRGGSRRGEAGQTLVEFCICALVFFMLVFGVVDLARGVFAYNTIAHCAREGVRFAVVHGTNNVVSVGPLDNDATLASVVRGFATGLQTNNLTVLSSWPNGNGTGMVVNVTVLYTFQPVTLFFRTLALSNSSAAIILH